MSDGRGLLVAQVCAQRNFTLEGSGAVRHSIEPGIRRRTNGGQHPAWNVKEAEQLIIPFKSFEIKEHCAAGVRNIRDVRATIYPTGQVPDKPGVYVAEDGFTSFGGSACAFHVIENPLNLAAGKIGRER